MKTFSSFRYLAPFAFFLLFAHPAAAVDMPQDSDMDGYPDETEIAMGYDPHGAGRLVDADTDLDGLTNEDEVIFGTDMLNVDSDGDGHTDGIEVIAGYDPLHGDGARLKKRIEVVLSTQTMSRYLGPKLVASHLVSTGRAGMRTPTGTFSVLNKAPRAWSKGARLWMPFWMAFKGSAYGIHELPEWPGGKKEGEDHLGTPVSHGCVRLGVGAAQATYDWAEIGTEVIIKK